MSEQDQKSGGVSEDPVVLVDTSAASRNNKYRPNELQDDPAPDLHKRSKVPAVPSVTEELKDSNITEQPAAIGQIESMSSQIHIHVTNISPTGKRRGSLEDIAMVPLDTAMKDTIRTSPAPIPAQVETVVSDVSRPAAAGKSETKKGDDDTITEEIREMRTPEPVVREHSEWPSNSATVKKKEISWEDSEYLNKVRLEDSHAKATRCQSIFRDLNAKSQAAMLERKPSIGPCFKPSMLYGGPSGITICVPKKSIRTMKEDFNPIQSVIDINVSMKEGSESISHINYSKNPIKMSKKWEKVKELPKQLEKARKQEEALKINTDQEQIKFLGGLRTKLDNMSSRIRNLLNM